MRERLGAGVVLLALALPTAYAVWLGIRAVAFPYALDYGEGPLLGQAVHLARNEGIYRVPGAEPPWTISNYPPVYPWLESLGVRAFGPAYWYGRLLSLLSILAAALLAGAIVRRLGGDRLGAAITMLVLPGIPLVGLWACLARIDGVALVLSVAALWLLVRRPTSSAALAGAVGLLVVAVFTRQTYLLAAPLAGFVWLWRISRRRALAFAGALLLTVGVAGVVLQVATDGFWFNIVTANVNQLDLGYLAYYGTFLAGHLPVLVLLAGGYVVAAIRRPDEAGRLALPYLGAALLAALTVVKVGSSVNYLIELSVALSLATGLAVARLRRSRWRFVVGALLVLQAGLLLVRTDLYEGTVGLLDDPGSSRRLEQVITSTDGPILTDQEIGFLPLAGRPIELQPFEMTELARAGVWDQAPLIEAIRAERYTAILILYLPDFPVERQRWTDEALAAVASSYHEVERVPRFGGHTVVFRPRPP